MCNSLHKLFQLTNSRRGGNQLEILEPNKIYVHIHHRVGRGDIIYSIIYNFRLLTESRQEENGTTKEANNEWQSWNNRKMERLTEVRGWKHDWHCEYGR